MLYDLDFSNLNSHPLIELVGQALNIQDGIPVDPLHEIGSYSQDIDVASEISKLGMQPEYANTPHIKEVLGLNQLLQKKLMRPSGTERQQLLDSQYEPVRKEMAELLQRLGHIDAVEPKNLTPDALLLLGATEGGFAIRLASLHSYLEKGLKPSAIYLLGGQRPLWALHEKSAAILLADKLGLSTLDIEKEFNRILSGQFPNKQAKELNSNEVALFRTKTMELFKQDLQRRGETWPTELEMMQYISNQDETLKNLGIDIISVDTPMQPDGKGGKRRPNTADIIRSFHEEHGTNPDGSPLSVLAISSQPHIPYQRAAIENILPKHELEVIGCGVDIDKVNIAVALDAVALTLYTALPSIIQQLSTTRQLPPWVDRINTVSANQNNMAM